MSGETRTAAQQNSDSQGGYRSLAGYVFQLLGTVAEAVELFRLNPTAAAINELITLEAFGQDSFVCRVPGTGTSRFTQYKHSLTGEKISPSELREILRRFVESARQANLNIESCDFELATNRMQSPRTENLIATLDQYKNDPIEVNSTALEEQLWKGCGNDQPPFAKEMLDILKKLCWKTINEDDMRQTVESRAYDLGVLEQELDHQISSTLGLFLQRANSAAYRTISQQELDDKLAGYQDAISLRGDKSRRIQKQHIESELNRIKGNKAFARREIVNEIVSASLALPLVLVIGDGGRGKSAGVWQALLEHLRIPNQSPDFATGRHFSDFSEMALIDEFAKWRNKTPNSDGNSIERAIERLEMGCKHSNLMVLYIDGIDEKDGLVRPYPENRRFIEQYLRQLVFRSTGDQEKKVSFIVSCRTLEEAKWLTDIIGDANFKTVLVESFSDQELSELAMCLEDPPKNKLLSMIDVNREEQQSFNEPTTEDILSPLREPRIWASFVELDKESQSDYLKGLVSAKVKIAKKYLHQIEEKAAERLGVKLRKHVVKIILREAANISLQNNSETCTRQQWQLACGSVDLDRSEKAQLFDEFVTTGLFINLSNDGSRWSWSQFWLRDILSTSEEFA